MKKLIILILVSFWAHTCVAQEILFSPLSLKANSIEISYLHRQGNNGIIVSYGIPNRQSIIGKEFNGIYLGDNFSKCTMYSRIARVGYRHYIVDKLYWQADVSSVTNIYYGNVNSMAFLGQYYYVGASFNLGYRFEYKRLLFELYCGFEPRRGNIHLTAYNGDMEYILSAKERWLSYDEKQRVTISKVDNNIECRVNTFALENYLRFRVGFRL